MMAFFSQDLIHSSLKPSSVERISIPDAANNAKNLPAKEGLPVRKGEIEPGEAFYDIMTAHGVGDAEVLMMAQVSRKVFDLRKIRGGKSYELLYDNKNVLVEFTYEMSDKRLLRIEKKEAEWTAAIEDIHYEITERIVHGVITNSLYLSLKEACENPDLSVELADIYAWDIDFSLDLRKGDRFGILYEQRWKNGEYAGPGKIIASHFINQGNTYDAVYYTDRSGYGAYYDGDGKSLQKQFLKSPLRFKYISSSFSNNRLHPILKIRRPHLGVDYAAPYRTPVRAAADGRVIFIGRKGGMGKLIKIRHNSSYTTAYGHLSRYAKGLKVRKTVKQGQIIGYVGSTGLSTGPHLHYSFYKKGKLVNPMRIRNPRATKVPGEELPRFKQLAAEVLRPLEPHPFERVITAGRGSHP